MLGTEGWWRAAKGGGGETRISYLNFITYFCGGLTSQFGNTNQVIEHHLYLLDRSSFRKATRDCRSAGRGGAHLGGSRSKSRRATVPVAGER